MPTIEEYKQIAYQSAFGDMGENWIPASGFAANRSRIVKLYGYYQNLFNKRPDCFFWAGLAHMAGGAVVGGLDFFTSLGGDPSQITTAMVQAGKSIFEDLSWMHEAFLVDPTMAISLASDYDNSNPAKNSYATALELINSGEPAKIAEGNKNLLENEQYTIVQPQYDLIKNIWEADKMGSFTSNIHPYHRDFITSRPTGKITSFDDRWAWITEPGGMWVKWAEGYTGSTIGVDSTERSRLVNLPFDKILRQDFAPIIQELLPPGSQ
ncbi:hypothetical protein PDN30_15980 [Bacillus cereus]|nr:hypothetical protein [Bacillus cereus]